MAHSGYKNLRTTPTDMHSFLLKISHGAVHRSSLSLLYLVAWEAKSGNNARNKTKTLKSRLKTMIYWIEKRSTMIQNIGYKVESMMFRAEGGEKPQDMTGSNVIEASLHQMVFQQTGKETDRDMHGVHATTHILVLLSL